MVKFYNFVIEEIDDFYTIKIDAEIVAINNRNLFNMSYYMLWKRVIGINEVMNLDKLKQLLNDNNYGNSYVIVEKYRDNASSGNKILGWKTKEEVEAVVEYLESLMIIQKLCS